MNGNKMKIWTLSSLNATSLSQLRLSKTLWLTTQHRFFLSIVEVCENHCEKIETWYVLWDNLGQQLSTIYIFNFVQTILCYSLRSFKHIYTHLFSKYLSAFQYLNLIHIIIICLNIMRHIRLESKVFLQSITFAKWTK